MPFLLESDGEFLTDFEVSVSLSVARAFDNLVILSHHLVVVFQLKEYDFFFALVKKFLLQLVASLVVFIGLDVIVAVLHTLDI